MGNHMAMKKHISVHHVYLFDKEYTSAAEPGAELRSESAVDDTLQCRVCDLWFEEEFGLANHYSREHFDRIRGVADDEDDGVVANGERDGEVANKTVDHTDDKADTSDAGAEKTTASSSAAAAATNSSTDSTPRRSSRRHALKNMNPQHVRPETDYDDQLRAPSGVSVRPEGNEGRRSGDDAGRGGVSKGDSEEVDDDDDDDEVRLDGETKTKKTRVEEEEGEGRGVKEEGAGDLEAEAGVVGGNEPAEISPAKKGGLQCPLCTSSCNYRSLLLNHIKKFHPGKLMLQWR